MGSVSFFYIYSPYRNSIFMNYLDLIIGILLVFALIQGGFRGIIKEITSLAALIIGVWGAIVFSHWVAGLIDSITGKHPALPGPITFLITFIGILFLVRLLGGLIEGVTDTIALGPINHILGAIFSVLKYAFLLSIFFFLFSSIIDRKSEIITNQSRQKSILYTPIASFAPLTFPFLKNQYNDLAGRKDSIISKTIKTEQ